MTMSSSFVQSANIHTITSITPVWQEEKHLHSGDRIWILTDVDTYWSRYLPYSEPQELFRVGIYDLTTQNVGLAHFGKDIAFALVKAGLTPPPWNGPAPFAVELHRRAHYDESKGRYLVNVRPIPIDPQWHSIVPHARRMFRNAEHYPNSVHGMWSAMVPRAARENAIERAAFSMVGWFSAGDVKEIAGPVSVSSVLARLVEDKRLERNDKRTRAARYRVPSPIITVRSDWTD